MDLRILDYQPPEEQASPPPRWPYAGAAAAVVCLFAGLIWPEMLVLAMVAAALQTLYGVFLLEPGRMSKAAPPLLVGMLLLAAGMWMTGNAMESLRETGAYRARCSSNLRQIGQGMFLYAQQHGQVPPDLATLYKEMDMQGMSCPNAANADYIYLPPEAPLDTLPPGRVIAFEPLSNHGDEGINVLLADRSTRWLDRAAAEQVIQQAAAGGPVRVEAEKN